MRRLWWIFCLLVSSSAWGETVSAPLPPALMQGLQQLAELKGFSCTFQQRMLYSDGSEQRFEGTLAVARVGHFRWQYIKPYAQLYISNGDGIWLYEPDLMQAQWLQDLDALDPMAMRLLEGRVRADEVHLLASEDESYHIKLGDSSQAAELWLALNAKGLPAWFESQDALGNRNRMILRAIQTKKPDMQLFEFIVPKGVDVIDAHGRVMEKR